MERNEIIQDLLAQMAGGTEERDTMFRDMPPLEQGAERLNELIDSVPRTALATENFHSLFITTAGDMRVILLMIARCDLLNNLLGGPGMNARLNLSLRERHGLVYTVESTMATYGDTGIWSIYFGCDHHDISRCRKLVRHELDRLMQKPLSQQQLTKAKRQLKGQLAIACDNREQFALDFGRSYLHHGHERDLDTLFRRIDAITAEELQTVACDLFDPNNMTTLIFK